MIRQRYLCVFPLILLLGCSGPEGLEDESLGQQKGRFGLVSVSYDHDWSDSGQALLLTSTAQFVSYSAMDRDQVARVLALPLDPESDLPSPETCKRYDLSVELFADEGDPTKPRNVELLEAGDLRIQTEEGKLVVLAPRHFPWLLPFISGVVYGESQAMLVQRISRVKASSEGGEAVGPFAAQINSPALPRLIQIGGQDPEGVIGLSPRSDLPIRWQTADEQRTGDVTYIEIRHTKGNRDLAIRCRPRDDGAFVISHELFDDLEGRVTLELARLQQTAFSAVGLELGELRVTVRDRAALQLD